MLWGQLLAHDLSLSVGTQGRDDSPIDCCPFDQTELHPQCFPIYYNPKLATRDDNHREGVQCTQNSEFSNSSEACSECMNFVRSAVAPGCRLGARSQMNGNTAFLDGSEIY